MEDISDRRAEADLRSDILGRIAALIAKVWDAVNVTPPLKWSDYVPRDPISLIGIWTADYVVTQL
jgi:hypothetical protein